jgi:hypothetical protein
MVIKNFLYLYQRLNKIAPLKTMIEQLRCVNF